VKSIVKNGYGAIVLISQDGLGHGFGNFVLNKNIPSEISEKIGSSKDVRDIQLTGYLINHVLKDYQGD
jgi:hypothetical protein